MSNFFERLKRFVGVRLSRIRSIDDETALKLLYQSIFKQQLDLDNPKSFNEKIQWLKLYDRNPAYQEMVDKITAKEWAGELIGEDHIIPTLQAWSDVESMSLGELPNRFVLKTNHDSGTVIICDGKEHFDVQRARRILKKSLKRNFFYQYREWPYKNITPRIFAEQFISDSNDPGELTEADQNTDITDYKFLCYGGKCKYIFTCTGRDSGDLRVDFFDLDWNHLPFERHYPNADIPTPKPILLPEMIDIAETLSQGIPFVRVDLYLCSGNIYFGEMTFYPGTGIEEFSPVEWDYILGEPIEIESVGK